MTEILVPIAFFATVYGIFHLFVRRKERMALIDRDKTARIFEYEANRQPSLKYGLMLIGVAIGAFVGAWLDVATPLDDEVAYLGSIALFAGAGLLVHYLLIRKNNNQAE